MSAGDHLNRRQFPDYHSPELAKLPSHLEHRVPLSALHNVYSHEFNTTAEKIGQAFSDRQQDEPNGNDHPDVQAALKADIAKNGIREPLVIGVHIPGDRPIEHSIIDGSHRYLAAKDLGLDEVPIRFRR